VPAWFRRKHEAQKPDAPRHSAQHYFALSDKGQRRSSNQDRATARELEGGYTLLLVADGVGGSNGGETASTQTAEAVEAVLSREWISDPERALKEAVKAANDRVRETARADAQLANMATTLVVALVAGREAWIASIGDSRAYVAHDGEMRALTEDDSWVAEQIRSGALSEEDAAKSPYQNVITKGVGVEDTVILDITGETLTPGSTLLLCSDGLYRVVSPEEMVQALRTSSMERACKRLVDLANKAGGPDNISVALYRFRGTGSDAETIAG
jgi:PPM family protein phosphatase